MTAFQKSLLIAVTCFIVLGGILLFFFGTLSPCGMLTQELKAGSLRSMLAKNPRDQWEVAGVGLGAILTGAMIDSFVSALTPMQCTQALVRLKIEGKDIFADDLARATQSLSKDRFGSLIPPAPAPAPAPAPPPVYPSDTTGIKVEKEAFTSKKPYIPKDKSISLLHAISLDKVFVKGDQLSYAGYKIGKSFDREKK